MARPQGGRPFLVAGAGRTRAGRSAARHAGRALRWRLLRARYRASPRTSLLRGIPARTTTRSASCHVGPHVCTHTPVLRPCRAVACAGIHACVPARTHYLQAKRPHFQCQSAHFDAAGARRCAGRAVQVLEGAARHVQLARTALSQRAFENHLRRPSYSVPLAVNVLALSDEFIRLPHECVPLVPPKVLYICHCGRNH